MVLVVEDDETIGQIIADMLAEDGYTILHAGDGAIGVELARERLPDIILMDLMMPVLNGIEAIRQLRENPATGHIRIVAMSATASHLIDRDRLGADGVLHKPFDMVDLIEGVREQLAHARDDDQRASLNGAGDSRPAHSSDF